MFFEHASFSLCIRLLFWHFCQSVYYVQPSNNFSLPLLLGCTAGSAPQHLASLTQNASSSSRRVSPLCSTELIAVLSRNQVVALKVNKAVQWRPRVKSPVPLLEEKRNSSVFLIEYLSILCNFLTVWVSFGSGLSICLTGIQLIVFALNYQAGMFFFTFMCRYLPLADYVKRDWS